MKAFAILATVLVMTLSAFADATNVFENFAPHFSTNTQIIWEASTNHLPHVFSTYKRSLPRIFSEAVISNAIVLGSLQSKGFPKPSTNDFYISQDEPPNWCCGIPTIFGIQPGDAYLYYAMSNYSTGSDVKIPNDEAIAAQAWKYARQFGIDPSKLVLKSFFTYDTKVNSDLPANSIYGRGIFLSRKLDGISFFAPDDQGDGAEGFFIEFGHYGIIRSFTIRWSDVERDQSQPVASTQEIMQCIRTQKIIVLPDPGDETYFAKIKQMAKAKRFVISKITPYYTDSIFGEVPANNTPCKFITPVAELDVMADFGNSNMTVHVLSPITSSDVQRLLGK
jgi:hypothetical protein